jgi:ribonuclease HII
MLVAGIDEAGRGPVLGPMVLACVVIDSEDEAAIKKAGVRDSKELKPGKREELYSMIRGIAKEISSVHVPASEIDLLRKKISLNELEARKIAGLLSGLSSKPEVVYVDAPDTIEANFAKRIAKCGITHKIVSEHRADSTYAVCSAASVIAKVERDRAVRALEEKYGKLGSGYPHDPDTIGFLNKCIEKKEYPDLIRQSWDTFDRLVKEKAQKRLDFY